MVLLVSFNKSFNLFCKNDGNEIYNGIHNKVTQKRALYLSFRKKIEERNFTTWVSLKSNSGCSSEVHYLKEFIYDASTKF